MLEQFHLKSLHLESTKQERLFLSLMAVMGIVMDHEIHEQHKHQKHLNVFY